MRIHLVALFQKHLVVLAKRHAKDDGCDVLETMDPLLPFTSLAAYVKHAASTRSARGA